MIKGFVEPHILRLIRNDFKVASLKRNTPSFFASLVTRSS